MNSVCPNGYICINHFNAFGIIIVILIILYVVNKENYAKLYSKITSLESNTISLDNVQDVQYNVQEYNHNHNHNQEAIDTNNTNNSQDVSNNRRLINDPLYPPLSRNPHIETSKGLPINIETRESGGDFQQIGMLSKDSVIDDSEKSGNNNDSVILPLYGKPTYKGSTKWLYYTESDRNNAIKIPLTINGKDCTDDIGCSELNDNDKVSISSYNGDFNVKMYKFNKPRYIPYI